jgi:predicted ATPase
MISEITIKNYKSIVNQTVGLGCFNVLIGANGCGKSNFLEAISLAALSSSNKLDAEFFQNRGIRVTDPGMMVSAFNKTSSEYIDIHVILDNGAQSHFRLLYDASSTPASWQEVIGMQMKRSFWDASHNPEKSMSILENLAELFKSLGITPEAYSYDIKNGEVCFFNDKVNGLKSFTIYSPEESALRSFDPGTGIIDRSGRGLFPYLKSLSKTEIGQKKLAEIRDNLEVIDWFDNLLFPQDAAPSDYTIQLFDQYLEDGIAYFDQRSANEAFLYLLFYFTLFVSDDTPSFFAIDNIDSALNPKLCIRFVEKLIELSEKYNKQVIVTTHNPYVLDALRLEKDSQRLLVARRNIDGHTVMNRIPFNKESNLPLSEAWMKGYLGALPNNF